MSDGELRRVQALLEVGRWEAAQHVLAPLAARDPNSARIACLAARCHHLAQDWPAMLAAAERACTLAPDDEWAHRLRSIALRGLDRPVAAVAAAREAVRLNPQHWQAFVALAEALLTDKAAQSRQEAREAAARAVALAPESDDVRVLAGRVAMASGDLRAARAHYERILAGSPDHAAARNNLAVLDLRQSRPTAAAERMQAVVAANPTDPLFVRNAQLAATLWLARLHLAASGLYLACWLAAAVLSPGPVREGLAGLVAAGTAVLTALAYRRLPRGIARMVRRPAVALNDKPNALGALRRWHLIVAILAAFQIGLGIAMLAADLPLWTTLQLFATAGVVPVLIRLVRGWMHAASRAVRRRAGGAGTGGPHATAPPARTR